MHKSHRTLIKCLLLELRAIDLLRSFALYTWACRFRMSPTSAVFKIIFETRSKVRMKTGHVHKGHRTLIKL